MPMFKFQKFIGKLYFFHLVVTVAKMMIELKLILHRQNYRDLTLIL